MIGTGTMRFVARVQLRDLCGVRSGDKGNRSDLTVFADDQRTYEVLVESLTASVVAEHFEGLVAGPVERYEVPNIWAIKFVMDDALGGGGPRSLRSDNLGKTLGGALLRLWVEVPDDVVASSARAGRRAPVEPLA
ncbi:MAG: hypothetical protein ACKOYM_11465 [Actinomycetes bacterium]